ncbi:MAG: efflux RND transporter periplasmic adaptor subunit [Planctomycetota bacterium]
MNVQKILAIVLPVVVLALGVAGAGLLSQSETPPGEKPPPALPLVETMRLVSKDLELDVRAQGTVHPGREVTLAFEVSGRIEFVAEAFEEGAFLPADTVIAGLDTTDYNLRKIEADAEVADAKLQLDLELAEAEAAITEWREMQPEADPPALVAREPQLAQARARVKAAEARCQAAQRDVDRCSIKLPFAARVVRRSVEAFQFATMGTEIGHFQATEWAEIPLSIPDEDLRFLNLPLDRDLNESGPNVDLTATFGGELREWTGRVVRTESSLDNRSRQVQLIVRVNAPYTQNASCPLLPGLYVDASITGIEAKSVFVIPRSALFEERAVLVIDDQDRLRIREVTILRKNREDVVIRSGLKNSERLCKTRLDVVVEGRQVRTSSEPSPSPASDLAPGNQESR